MASSSSSPSDAMLRAAEIALAAKKMQIADAVAALKRLREEQKNCQAAVKREKELKRAHMNRMKAASAGGGGGSASKAKASGGAKAKKPRKKAPKNPNFKRPRGGAPKSEIHDGVRKVWNYDTGVWMEPSVRSSVNVLEDM